MAWTAGLAQSVTANEDVIRAWRVLVDETGPSQAVRLAMPDWRVLAAAHLPVILVHRIDGRVDNLDAASVLKLNARAIEDALAAGATVTGIEIDFDCATARLADYSRFLRQLRQEVPAWLSLSITALPTWLGSPRLHDLLAVPDQTVLQVHAVDNPKDGLFDADRAFGWIDRWAKESKRPFLVALPAYSVRVDWSRSGQIVAVTSEAPRFASGDVSAELVADPAIIADFVRRLKTYPPATLAGLAWFRLPSGEDKRAWSQATWHDVLAKKANFAPVISAFEPGSKPGLLTINLINPGRDDTRLPQRITLDPACTVGDGANGYDAVRVGKNLVLQRRDDGLLPGFSTRIIGWTRCLVPEPANYLEP